MNFFYILYLIILVLPGETIIQLCFPLKKEKLLRYSILKHLVYFIILGLCFSSLISLLLSIFQKLSIFSLIIINLSFFLISFFLDIFNRKVLNKYVLIFRIIEAIKSEKFFLKNLKKDYLISIIISIVFIILFISILNYYIYLPNQDIWRYAEWAIDIAKYQPNILKDEDHIEWYFGQIYYTNFYNFFLSSLILGDIESWDFILKFIIPILIIILLILLIIDFTCKINKKINFLPVIFLSSSYYLLNWSFYSLPTNIACILGILSIFSLFDKERRSYLMFGVCIIFQYLFHTPTTSVFLIAIGLNLFILFLIKIGSKELRARLSEKIKEKFSIYILLSIIISAIIIGGAIVFFTPILFSPTYFERFLDLYTNLQNELIDYEIRSLPPAIFFWIRDLIGPHIILLSLFSIIFLVREFKKTEIYFFKSKKTGQFSNEKVKTQNMILLFFWVFLITLILICIFLPIWYWFSTFPYMYYRYFIYIDLTCLFLTPYGFNMIIKYFSQIEYKKKYNFKIYKKIFQVSFIGGTLFFTSFHYFIRNYNVYKPYDAIPEANLNIYYWLKKNTSNDSIYCASPYSDCGPEYYHPIMNDRRFLDPSFLKDYFDDSKYYSINSLSYYRFISDLYFAKKLLNLQFANIMSQEWYTSDKVDYIILDDLYNPNLVKLMLEDNDSFNLLKKWTDSKNFYKITFTVYLFYLNESNNYFLNPKFDLEYTEWFLVQKHYGSLYRSDFDPYEGNYSLLFNKSRNLYGHIKSKMVRLKTQFNYSFSCYLKFIKYLGEPSSIRIRFWVNYYDLNQSLLSHECINIFYNYNNSVSYSFFNLTFPIIFGSYYQEIEIEIYTNPRRRAIISLDNISLIEVN